MRRLLTLLSMLVVCPGLFGHGYAQQIYWVDGPYASPALKRANANGTTIQSIPLATHSLPEGVAQDVANGKVYWSELDFSSSDLQKANLDFTLPTSVLAGGSAFRGVALDTAGGKMYWTSTNLVTGSKIHRANLNGTSPEVLIDFGPASTENLRGIALDVPGGKMYWADFGLGKIRRANLAVGAIPEDLLSGLSGPVGIDLDLGGGNLYWTEANGNTINRSNLDGTAPAILVSSLATPNYITLDVSGNTMFWTEIGIPAIKSANLDGSSVVTLGIPATLPAGIVWVPGAGTCDISSVAFSNEGGCSNNSTLDPADDFFTADVAVVFSNPPSTGSLQIEPGGDALPGGGATSVLVGDLVGNSHTFTGVRFKADGTPTVAEVEFTADNGCVRTQVGPTVNSCSGGLACDISSVAFSNEGGCSNNGTVDPADDFFTADVAVVFANPPATGSLQIEPGGDALPGGGATSVLVGDLVGNSHTFTGVRFKADGTPTVAEVEFTADNGCVRTQVGPTVSSCSILPNLIANPGFESGTAPWVFFTNGSGSFGRSVPGADGTGNAAKLVVTTTGTNVQFYQSGITLRPATLYRLKFKAYSANGRDLAVSIIRHDAPYTSYGLNGRVVNLTTSWQEFAVQFTTVNFPPPTPTNARLRFTLNGYAANGTSYFIDDVMVEEVPVSPPVAAKLNVETAPDGSGAVVPAQTIETGDGITVYAVSRTATDQFVENITATWTLEEITGGVAAGDLVPAPDGRSAVFTGNTAGSARIKASAGALALTPSEVITVIDPPPPVTNILVNGGFEGGTTGWFFNTNGVGSLSAVTPGIVGSNAAQVSMTTQGTVTQMYQRNITLTAGRSYRLSIKALCNTGHDMALSVFKHTSPFTSYGLSNSLCNLTGAWQTFVVDFVASGFVGTAGDARVRIWMGTYDANGDVYRFDDAKLEELPGPPLTGIASSAPPEATGLPSEFGLSQNYPNPFNPTTTIRYELPEDSRVTLKVFNILGQEVATLVAEDQEAGYRSVEWSAAGVASGVYLCRLQAGDFVQMRRMVLLK